MRLVENTRGIDQPPLHEFLRREAYGWTTRELGEHIGVSQATAVRLLNGGHVPKEPTLAKIAKAFDLPITEVRRMAHRSAGELGPVPWPDEFNQLPQPMREALFKICRTYLDGVGEHSTQSA